MTLAGRPRADQTRGGPAAAVHLVDTIFSWLQSNPLTLSPLRCRRIAHLAFLVGGHLASLTHPDLAGRVARGRGSRNTQ